MTTLRSDDLGDEVADANLISGNDRHGYGLPYLFTLRSIHFYGILYGMRAAIDKAGRLVIPKVLRDSLGLVPGEVEVTPDGAGLHIEPLANDYLTDEDGLLVIPAADVTVSDDLIRTLRDADQR